MNPYHIPQHLDAPFKIMLWTIDEFLILVTPFLIFMFGFGSPLWGILVGTIGMMGIRKIKGEQGHTFLLNVMYWYLPPIIQLKAMPPSYLRLWIG